MLANHIAENCNNFEEIEWTNVTARNEFAGHTERSLRHMYFCISKQTRIRMNIQIIDVRPQHIAQYCKEIYGEGGIKLSVSSSKKQRQRDVIAFFENKVSLHNLLDFL